MARGVGRGNGFDAPDPGIVGGNFERTRESALGMPQVANATHRGFNATRNT
jgi:hypothetical protein